MHHVVCLGSTSFLQDAVIKPSNQYLPSLSLSLWLRVMISLVAEPLFYLTNQRPGCYRITPRFKRLSADRSTQDDAEKNKEKGGRDKTVRLILGMSFF